MLSPSRQFVETQARWLEISGDAGGKPPDSRPVGKFVIAARIGGVAATAVDQLHDHTQQEAVLAIGQATRERDRYTGPPLRGLEQVLEVAARIRRGGAGRGHADREEVTRELAERVAVCGDVFDDRPSVMAELDA